MQRELSLVADLFDKHGICTILIVITLFTSKDVPAEACPTILISVACSGPEILPGQRRRPQVCGTLSVILTAFRAYCQCPVKN
jgi:hypothetical protein